MSDAKPADVAEALDRLAQHEQRPLIAATLRLAAAQLRDDALVEQQLTQLLALLPVERLISVASLLAEQQTHQRARQAATYLNMAGLILMEG